jgi:hypothetical protein
MKTLAIYAYNDSKMLSNYLYESQYQWDANRIYGCLCDRAISINNQFNLSYFLETWSNTISYNTSYGANDTIQTTTQHYDIDALFRRFYRGPYAYTATDFIGYNCGEYLCPKGDDPSTYGVNEIQSLRCRADNGTFRLTFRENTTIPISFNASATTLQSRLEDLFT